MSPVPVSLTLSWSRRSPASAGSMPKLSMTTGSTLKLLIHPPPLERGVRDDRELVALDLVIDVEPALGADARQAEARDALDHRGLGDELIVVLQRVARGLEVEQPLLDLPQALRRRLVARADLHDVRPLVLLQRELEADAGAGGVLGDVLGELVRGHVEPRAHIRVVQHRAAEAGHQP